MIAAQSKSASASSVPARVVFIILYDVVVQIVLVVLDEAGGGGVGPLDLPHVLPQLAPEYQHHLVEI